MSLKLDAIVAIGDSAIRAVRRAATTIPIIAASDDLVGEGHVASLGHPGGNVTGVSILASQLNAKRLELLKAAVPTASHVAVLWDPATGTFHLPGCGALPVGEPSPTRWRGRTSRGRYTPASARLGARRARKLFRM